VQTIAMHRILRAELTYVIAPEGYVGRTTCYEIGRIVQANQPLYFSHHPRDLPLLVPDTHIADIVELISRLRGVAPVPLRTYGHEQDAEWERQLILGNYLEL
jgi:hypothetical protein